MIFHDFPLRNSCNPQHQQSSFVFVSRRCCVCWSFFKKQQPFLWDMCCYVFFAFSNANKTTCFGKVTLFGADCRWSSCVGGWKCGFLEDHGLITQLFWKTSQTNTVSFWSSPVKPLTGIQKLCPHNWNSLCKASLKKLRIAFTFGFKGAYMQKISFLSWQSFALVKSKGTPPGLLDFPCQTQHSEKNFLC